MTRLEKEARLIAIRLDAMAHEGRIYDVETGKRMKPEQLRRISTKGRTMQTQNARNDLRDSPHRHIMIDIETLGLARDSVILSIGARMIGSGRTFYEIANIWNGLNLERRIEHKTLSWWLSDSERRSAVPIGKGGCALEEILQRLDQWMREGGLGSDASKTQIWANSPSFDLAILRDAYRQAKINCPWEYWQERDYRTLKSFFPSIEAQEYGIKHNALDDAIRQVKHLERLLACTPLNPQV